MRYKYWKTDVLSFGSAKTISKALERMLEKEEVFRVAHCIYTRVEKDPILVLLKPGGTLFL